MLLLRAIGSIAVSSAVSALLLFGPAGTLHWRRGWVFVAVLFFASVASTLALAGHEELLKERLKPPIQKGQPLADKILTPLFAASFLGLIGFTSADAGRWQLLGRPSVGMNLLGAALFCGGWFLVFLGLRENAFAAPVVRHQEERGQTVIDTGIYGIVRHPMYSGAAPLFIGIPLWLGSYAGLGFGLLPLALLVARVFVEERILRHELPGYEEYTQRVRYRLVPYVW